MSDEVNPMHRRNAHASDIVVRTVVTESESAVWIGEAAQRA
ncbi:hypothetical protein HDA30_001019 [Micrococcus cohnii]|uniref:Uncharacterized protein n=1 Tax=Micrococcus cohnii TaxID=993416 RepID=A0A7W7M3C5_9MICC|nr:hypothetical protein [Micrococcus cohnii]